MAERDEAQDKPAPPRPLPPPKQEDHRPEADPPRRDDPAPATAIAKGLWRLPGAGLILTAVLTVGWFVIALGMWASVLFSVFSLVAAVLAGYLLHRRLKVPGGTAILIGGASALATMAIAWIYQTVDLRAGLPILSVDADGSWTAPPAYVVSAALGALAGNLFSQLRADTGSGLPQGLLTRLLSKGGGAANGDGWTRSRIAVALLMVAALIGAVWTGYLAWFPFCLQFGVYEFCGM